MAKYLKPDCELGYVEDNVEIDYLKFNNLRHSILGCMLGDFDENGYYVVSPEIAKELILMKKYLFESMDNIEICKSELKLDKQLTFMITFEGNKATLSLLEKINYEANYKINSGLYSNINEYVLDEVETSGEVDRNVIYQRWNISEYEGNIIDIFNCDDAVLEKYFGIVNRFKYLLQANKILLDKEDEIEAIEIEYGLAILDILSHYPKLEKIVKAQIKDTLNEKKDFVRLDKPNFAKTLNEIIDNAIETNLEVLNEKEKEEFNIEQRNVKLNSNIKKQNTLQIKKVELNYGENQKEASAVNQLEISKELSAQTLLEVAQNYARTERRNKTQAEQRAIRILAGDENSEAGSLIKKKTQNQSEYEKMLNKLTQAGVKESAIVGDVVETVVNKKRELTIKQQKAGNIQTAQTVKSGTNKTENKDTTKKTTNSKTTKKTTNSKSTSKNTTKSTSANNKKPSVGQNEIKKETNLVAKIGNKKRRRSYSGYSASVAVNNEQGRKIKPDHVAEVQGTKAKTAVNSNANSRPVVGRVAQTRKTRVVGTGSSVSVAHETVTTIE